MKEDCSVAARLEVWLAERGRVEPEKTVFWAPHGWSQTSDWVTARGVEHLAVLISTAIRRDNNVCTVSGTQGRTGRSANLIGLISRQPLGWAVVVEDAEEPPWAGDVQRRGYPHDNYDAFGALSAAEIGWAWVTLGRLPKGLEIKMRRG